MVRRAALVVCDRLAWLALGVAAGALSATTVFSQPAQPAAPAPQAQAAASPRVLTADAGLVLNFIKPDKTKDFEAIVGRLKEALGASDKPARREQAKCWRVFKAAESAAGGAALYVYFIDSPVKNADYTVTTLLAEATPPEEMAKLSKQYAETYATGQNFVNLTLVADLGK